MINLSVDKSAVLREMARVLVPGGRIGISDVVAEDQLTAADRAARGSYVGCIAGALSRSEYLTGLADAGFVDASVEFTHETAPGLHGAIIRATKPTDTSTDATDSASRGACCDTAAASSCCAPSAKSSCCGAGTADALPTTCGCR